MKIILDPGHGYGPDHNRGSVLGNEGDNNYYYSLELKKELEKYKNIKISTTRGKITDNPSLKARAEMGEGADLLLSLHSNAYNGKIRGVEVHDCYPINKRNTKLANLICENISKEFSIPNRGSKYWTHNGDTYFAVLRDSKAKSSLLIEHCFHDNKEDCKIYFYKRKEMAKVVADTIAKYYKLKKEIKTIGVFGHSSGDDKAIEKILKEIPGAVKFNYNTTPIEIFDEILQIGGKKALHNKIKLIAGKNRWETMELVEKYLIKE